LPPVSETGYKDQDALIIAGKRDIVTAAIAGAREWVLTKKDKKAKKIYTPFDKFNFLSIKRLKYILENLKRNSIKEKDAASFVASCLKAFPYEETRNLLEKWGAPEAELAGNDSVSPYFILEVMAGHFSQYVLRETEREITPVEEYIKHIEIQGIKFALNFEEIELSHHARNFYYLGGPRSAALMLASIFNGRIIYNDAKNDKNFYFFNGHIWVQEPDIGGIIYDTLLSIMVYFARQKKESASGDEEPDSDGKKFYAALNRVEDRRERRDIEFELAGLKGIYHNTDKKDDTVHFDGIITKETLTLLDGVLDFSGDKLIFRESRSEEYRRAVLPYTVEQVKGIKVSYFWKIMRGNFKNEDTLETFMYYLSLIASRVQYKYGAFLIGGKDTGKSTVIQMIKGIYQHLIGFLDADILVPKEKRFSVGNGPTPYIAALEGLGAAITVETEDGATLNAALWKKLTGNDIIPARGLNEAPKEFANTAQIIIASNMIPRFNRHDPSVVERIIVIPFLVNHARGGEGTARPEDITAELEKEYPGIIRVFAKHYIKLKNEYGGVIPVSRESRSYKTDVIAEVETELDEFVNINVSFEEGKTEIIRNIYDKYLAYFGYNEESAKQNEALSRQKFSTLFMKNYKGFVSRGIQRIQGNTSRVFTGMRLKTDDEIAAEAAAKEKENASTQVAAQGYKSAVPVAEPVEDEDPFN
jgi:hypothetical protein